MTALVNSENQLAIMLGLKARKIDRLKNIIREKELNLQKAQEIKLKAK